MESTAMMVAVLAEKPAVARDIAKVLGASRRGEGHFHGSGYVVTWAIGHLVGLAQPHEIDPAWRAWRRELLPMLPQRWPLVVLETTGAQFEIVKRILTSRTVERVVCATDAGREGELIFRTIYEATACDKPVSRLWISSLTSEAIRDGFARLKDASHFDGLADAARSRSRADWLVGLNLSRAYSLALDEKLSVGRVQTPTLAMVVERELAIRAFVPEDYFEVVATFALETRADDGDRYAGKYFREPTDDGARPTTARLPADGDEAARIVERVRSGHARVAAIDAESKRLPPPLFYDLTELQRHANRLFGFSAKRTLEIAQSLYEERKLITYPRTDSRHLSSDVAATLPAIVAAIADAYREELAPGTGERQLSRRFVDDARVTDHHAIIPTVARASGLRPDEQKIYDLVCRRLLSAWHGDYVWSTTTVITAVESSEATDRFHSEGTTVVDHGWKVLDHARKAEKGESLLPSGLAPGREAAVLDASTVAKKTEPPRRFTDATLLTAMETAGRTLDEKELSDAMRECGLGTPATRATIIETLLQREYLVRQGKSLAATDRGIRLVEVVHPEVKSPVMTGQWEAKLARMQRGTEDPSSFMRAIEDYVREVTSAALSLSRSDKPDPGLPREPGPATIEQPRDVDALLRAVFGFSSFRPYQEAVCRASVDGSDVLLVMPTGAGKSLCYQLPGLARGGTTLVVSPLIALMEDQVAKLSALGLAAARIHSGRDRQSSRQACADYLAGKLNFLFIAPERLAVSGFPELLAKRKPTLVAVDEAHCISHWGHDFRPEYRMLGQRLPMLRPAPIVALTATATPKVQDDIVRQLGAGDAKRFIHGFRRTNIAVEVIEMSPGERAAAVEELLVDGTRRPAIVYAPTRKQAETLAAQLAGRFSSAAYHAGVRAAERERVQGAFARGEVEVVVATIAFGMGIDKANVRTIVHTALPGSVEAYYQEIGRAGRDGLPARALLMHSFVDRKTHEFFHERDYPDPTVIDRLFAACTPAPQSKEALQERFAEDPVLADASVFERAIEKLWIHGGALVDPEEHVRRGGDAWREAYVAQRAHKLASVGEMARWAEKSSCRMLGLVRHFGDQEDSGQACGLCDVCAADTCVARSFREPSQDEKRAILRVLDGLGERDGQATGRLHRELFDGTEIDRRSFEHLLGGLVRAGLVRLSSDEFEKDGEVIEFQRAHLTNAGRREISCGTPPPGLLERVSVERERVKRKKDRKRRDRRARPEPAARIERIDATIADELRAWRLAEARRMRVPAFRILTDRVLFAIAAARPRSADELLAVRGIGPSSVEKYGDAILAVTRATRAT
jgi:DNA topoisomerase-3